MSKLTAINDLDKAHVAAQSGNDPSPYADWFNEHAPPGQRVEIKPGTKGGYDVNHFAVGSSDDGPPAIKQINQQHFPTLDDIGEEAQNLVHSDDLYKAQIHGMTSPNWIAARGEGNVPLSLNKRNGKYYTQDGQLYNGKLAPTANDVTMQMMGGQFGMSGAQPSAMQQPHPGSQFIGSALTPQQQTQATAPNTGFDVSRYIGDGTDGYQ
ncbi:MAG TPA: hypothetical protein VFE79_26790 [Paraburkholderia sp.]|nr:hypothetical protein [Paraburkholderia sp.]